MPLSNRHSTAQLYCMCEQVMQRCGCVGTSLCTRINSGSAEGAKCSCWGFLFPTGVMSEVGRNTVQILLYSYSGYILTSFIFYILTQKSALSTALISKTGSLIKLLAYLKGMDNICSYVSLSLHAALPNITRRISTYQVISRRADITRRNNKKDGNW